MELYYDWSIMQERENEVVGAYDSNSDTQVNKLKNGVSYKELLGTQE